MEWDKDAVIRWRAYEYPYKKYSSEYRIGAVIIALSIAIISLINDNFLLAIISILGGAIFIIFSRKKPEYCEFCIDNDGIFAKNTLYEIETINGYNISSRNNKHTILSIETDNILHSLVHFPIKKRYVELVVSYFNSKNIDRKKDLKQSFYDIFTEYL